MNTSKLIEKCRKGVREACDEVKDLRSWFRERLGRFEEYILRVVLFEFTSIVLSIISIYLMRTPYLPIKL